MRLCFPGVTWKDNRQDGYVKFRNGAEIWFCGLDDKERVEKILGMEFSTIYFNEASQIPYSSYVVAKTRLAQVSHDRLMNRQLKQREYVDLNPVGASHWTYQLFVKKLEPSSKVPLDDPDQFQHMFINPLDNSDNLDPEMIKALQNLPERQRRRFFSGEYVSDIEGALWPLEVLESCHCEQDEVPTISSCVVAIDPSGTAGKDDKRSDDVGISVVGKGVDGRAYVLADRTCNLGPLGWARVAIDAFHEFKADRIIAERNFGGAMVEATIRSVDSMVPYTEVTASRGKAVRAEPVAALYEKGLVRHVGRFVELEEQYSNFSTNGYQAEKSPDRADAAIWGISNLMLDDNFDLGTYIKAFGNKKAVQEFERTQR